MSLETTCRKIKSLEIQGATNVAVAAVEALADVALISKAKSVDKIFEELLSAKRKLFATRPTEPMLRNFLDFMMFNLQDAKLTEINDIKKSVKRISAEVLKMKKDAKESIKEVGSSLISDKNIIYTHCHSTTVTGIIKKAAKTKKLEVFNTETRPLFQGRLTAEELAKSGIRVTHFVDSAVRYALKKADVMLIGADAITPTGIFNKIGSHLFAEIAKKYDVPVYVCSVAWKFDPATIFGHEEVVEMRSEKEVWDKAPNNVKIMNYAFEKVDSELVTGIISELGVYKPDSFLGVVKKAYPWMFRQQD